MRCFFCFVLFFTINIKHGVSATVTGVLISFTLSVVMPDDVCSEDRLWLRNSAAINVCDAADPEPERTLKYSGKLVTGSP